MGAVVVQLGDRSEKRHALTDPAHHKNNLRLEQQLQYPAFRFGKIPYRVTMLSEDSIDRRRDLLKDYVLALWELANNIIIYLDAQPVSDVYNMPNPRKLEVEFPGDAAFKLVNPALR